MKPVRLIRKNGEAKLMKIYSDVFVPEVYIEEKPQSGIEEFVDCTPNNIIELGGFSTNNQIVPKRIIFQLTEVIVENNEEIGIYYEV